jgi:hypothetical protein
MEISLSSTWIFDIIALHVITSLSGDKTSGAEGWGAKVIDRLSSDLVHEFPDMKGFFSQDLKYMLKFAETWRDISIVQELLAQITWYHHIALLFLNQ